MGIGALCAEERRRRTQTVQKIADNARRIRQSPRYAHGAAAVAVREQEFEDHWTVYGDGDEMRQREVGDLEGHRRMGRFGCEEGGKMPELPSVVEEEYGRLERKRKKKASAAGRPDFVEEHGQREHVSRTELERSRIRQGTQLPPNQTSQAPAPAKKSSWELVSYRSILRDSTSDEYILERSSPGTKLFRAGKQGRKYRNPENSLERTVIHFATRNYWISNDDARRELSSSDIVEDVNMFFDKANINSPLQMDMEHACEIADHLLRLALGQGLIQEIRSLLLWKIAVNVLDAEDLYNIVSEFATVVEKMGPEPALQFYSDLFATFAFDHASPSERFRLDLKIRAEVLKMPDPEEFEEAYSKFTKNIHIPAKLEYNDMAEILGGECRRLVDHENLAAAVDLWCTVTRARGSYSTVDASLDKELFDAAVEAKHLSLCARMLRLKESSKFSHSIRQQKDAFIKVCFEEGATGLLRNLFRPKVENALGTSKLSAHSYKCLSLCFAEDSRGFESFSVLYKRVPPSIRASVAEASVTTAAFSLKADWKATRDLEAIWTKYQQAIERYAQDGIDEQALRPFHVAMTEIQLSANKPLQAMKGLATMKEAQLDSNVAILTALALAKQNDWSPFERLLSALQKHPVDWTAGNKRAFNNALHLFSRQHTVQQLSDLVETAVTRLDFSPNKATWEIFLSCIVSNKSMSLLKHWLCNPGVLGGRIELDADIGAALMKTWYLDFRHSHQMVMWFCRNLVHAAPSLYGGQLWNVVREALGFDLRTLRGTNAPWMEPILRQRADLLSRGGDNIPRPGHIWNRQLYPGNQSPGLDQKTSANPREGDALEQMKFTDSKKDDASKEDVCLNSAVSLDPINVPIAGPDWQEIRPSYSTTVPSEVVVDQDSGNLDVPTLERQMILQLSLGHYKEALQMYQDSLDAAALPASPIVLEVALEASLRLHKDSHEAERIMTTAANAGMNVACAMGPLLIDQMRHLRRIDKQTASNLRARAINYYRMNERNGLHVKHYVGVHAAYVLINNGFAELGINLLSTIFRSPWSSFQPLDITAMSVWFLGYADLGHLQGMHWVVQEVSSRNMSIDMGFIRTLRRARRPARRRADGSVSFRRQERKTTAYLKMWSEVFTRKREAQMQASKVFGRKMISVMARAANGGVGAKRTLPYGVFKKIERRRRRRRARAWAANGGVVTRRTLPYRGVRKIVSKSKARLKCAGDGG